MLSVVTIAPLTPSGMTMSERVSSALVMLVKGMVMVFTVLAILMLVLMIMEKVFSAKNKKAETKTAVAAPAVGSEAASEEDDGAVVAAITAAISMALEAEGSTGGFRVVSFKRAPGKTAWNRK